MANKLSVLIPTLNEEENIGACLDSLPPNGRDEVVVLDSLSADKTADIARERGAKVLSHAFEGYARQKNWGLDRLAHDWVLILDADERLTPALREEILRVLENPSADGFFIRRETFFLGKRARAWSGDTVLRLFRRSLGRYPDDKTVHEEIVLRGKVGRLRAPMEHHTFRSYAQYMPKVEQFTTLAAREAFQRGKKISWAGLLLRPAFHFFKKYVLKGGFLDGSRGVMVAWLSAYSTYLKYAKLWEMAREKEKGGV